MRHETTNGPGAARADELPRPLVGRPPARPVAGRAEPGGCLAEPGGGRCCPIGAISTKLPVAAHAARSETPSAVRSLPTGAVGGVPEGTGTIGSPDNPERCRSQADRASLLRR